MADKNKTRQHDVPPPLEDPNDVPPPLEDPNSHDYVCVSCKNKLHNLCLECQHRVQVAAKSVHVDELSNNIYYEIDLAPLIKPIDQGMIAAVTSSPKMYVRYMIVPPDHDSDSDSDTSSNKYANNISDSPRSTDTSLDFNDIIENVDGAHGARYMDIYRAVMNELTFKPLIVDGRIERDSDSDTDYSDMPPLEEIKKIKNDSDEDSDDMPPLEQNSC